MDYTIYSASDRVVSSLSSCNEEEVKEDGSINNLNRVRSVPVCIRNYVIV